MFGSLCHRPTFVLSAACLLSLLPGSPAPARAQIPPGAPTAPHPAASSVADPPILPPPPAVFQVPSPTTVAPSTVAPTPVAPAALPPPPTLASTPAPTPPPPSASDLRPFVEFTTLRLLRDRGLISADEFRSAMVDLQNSLGNRAGNSTTLVVGRFATTIFGFAQADVMWFSTQSFNDYAGNLQVARPDTYAGQHGRTEFSARDSRLGFRIQAPELPWMRASALLETDFLGPTNAIGSGISEASFFNNPVLRIRHAYFKLETPAIDILFGHTWHLFGFQPSFVPADVQWSGVVGSLFARTMQLRISKTFRTKPVTLELAVSGNRPPQRDSLWPEFEAGARLSFNKWSGVHTLYVTATTTMAASIGVSADVRHVSVPQFSATPQGTVESTGYGIAVDAFLPIIPGTAEKRDNALSIVGEFVSGQGINDMYVGLVGGVSNPPLPAAMGMAPPTYSSGSDPGLVVFDKNGDLQMPHWMTFIVGVEYYLPKVGSRLGLFANFARSQLLDSDLYVNPAKVRDNEMFYNAGLFFDLSQAVRVGADWAYFDDQYADGVHATTHAVQGVGFFFF